MEVGGTGLSPPLASDDLRDRRQGLVIVLVAVLVYVALHMGFRLLASSTLGEDDTLDQILVQDLRAGYNPRQPPLYDWVLWVVQHVTGPHLIGFLAIKYTALTATAVLLYLSAYRILRDRLWALLTVESLALIYQISWRYHEGFTHEVLAMVAVAATLWAFLRLIDRGSLGDHVMFGLISGLGLLTEPNYAVYQLCLWISALLDPEIRERVTTPALAVSAAIAVVVASPFYLWVISDPQHWQQIFRPGGRSHLHSALIGFKDAVRGPFMYLAPLIVIVPAIFPASLKVAWSDLKSAWPWRGPRCTEEMPALERLVLRTVLVAIALSILGGLLLGIAGYAMHVLMPLYVTSVIWLMGAARRSAGSDVRLTRLAKLALAIAVIAFFARMANMYVHDPVCGKCRWGIPYAGLAAEMRKDGFSEDGTIIAIDDELAGNMRQHFPHASIVTRLSPDFTPANARPDRGSISFIWDATVPAKDFAHAVGRLAPPQGLAAARLVRVPWHHLWKPEGYRTSDWRLLVISR